MAVDFIYAGIITAVLSAAVDETSAFQFVDVDKDAVPCLGLQNVLSNHEDVVACDATWEGDISSGNADGICKNGWRICTREDENTLVQVSWYEAMHISGCYVINASHDGETCGPCDARSGMGEMAAIGADCVSYNKTKSSCFGQGKIDASSRHVAQYTPCHYAPWITGILCCREKREHPKVQVTASISPSKSVVRGTSVTMHCFASGPNDIQYSWYKNDRLIAEFSDYATLTINAASVSDSGIWNCRANYSYGSSDSPPIYLRVVELKPKSVAKGCKNVTHGRILASTGGNVVLCDGSWKGHVRSASKKLCAKGWKVCSNEDRRTLHSFLWEESLSVNGCYAYNAASTKYFPCRRCSPRNTGSRMAGIGRDCGNQQREGYSCLGQGRIDVVIESRSSRNKRSLRTCRYTEGLTTGVACCRKTKRKVTKRCKCKNNSTCTMQGNCVCRSGFTGKHCQKKARS